MHLLKSFSIYTIGYLFTQAINFLLIPVFTHYLTPVDYGILSLITTISSFIAPVVMLSADGAISIEYYRDSFKDFGRYVTSSLFNTLVAVFLISIIIFVCGSYLQSEFSIPKIYLELIPLICFMEGIKTINLLLFQVKSQSTSYALYSLSNTLFNILLALLFVVVLKFNYTGRLYGQYIIAVVYFIIGIIMLVKQGLLKFEVKKKYMRDAFYYGLPLLPHAIGFVIINLADRLFISRLMDNRNLGVYSLAYTLGSIILMVALAFNNAFSPIFFQGLKEDTDQSKLRIVKITYLYILALFVATMVLIGFTPVIFKYFINVRFIEGIKLVPWIAFSCFFFGCYLAFTNYISYLKKNKVFAYVSLTNIILNLILNYVLIRLYGIEGAAYATFLSFLVFSIIIAVVAIRLYPMPWRKVFPLDIKNLIK